VSIICRNVRQQNPCLEPQQRVVYSPRPIPAQVSVVQTSTCCSHDWHPGYCYI
jgi:hypothetical protein